MIRKIWLIAKWDYYQMKTKFHSLRRKHHLEKFNKHTLTMKQTMEKWEKALEEL